jgi:hypothetical protein
MYERSGAKHGVGDDGEMNAPFALDGVLPSPVKVG